MRFPPGVGKIEGVRWRDLVTRLPLPFPEGDTIPALSDELGDYGVFWNPTAGQGFVWANVDYASEFAAGYIAPDDPIPAVSQWGMIAMMLALLTLGKIYFDRRRAACEKVQ